MFGIDKSVVSTSHMEGQQNLIFLFFRCSVCHGIWAKDLSSIKCFLFAKRNMIQSPASC